MDRYRSTGGLLVGCSIGGAYYRVAGYSMAGFLGVRGVMIGEFPKIRGTLFWGPYNKDPTT